MWPTLISPPLHKQDVAWFLVFSDIPTSSAPFHPSFPPPGTFSSHGGRALSEEVQTACLELLAAATSVADSSSRSNPSHSCGGTSNPASGQPDNGSSPRVPTSPHSHASPEQHTNHGSDTGAHDSHAKGTKRLREPEQNGEGEETEEVLERRKQTLAALRAALSLLSKAHGKLVDADVRAASLVGDEHRSFTAGHELSAICVGHNAHTPAGCCTAREGEVSG